MWWKCSEACPDDGEIVWKASCYDYGGNTIIKCIFKDGRYQNIKLNYDYYGHPEIDYWCKYSCIQEPTREERRSDSNS